MPEPQRPSDRSAAQRRADHAGLARLSETLVPALVAKLNSSGLGELEVREGDWKIRLRRPPSTTGGHRRPDRTRPASLAPERREAAGHASAVAHAPGGAITTQDKDRASAERAVAVSPAVGILRNPAVVGTRVRQGDRIAAVDLLGIPQDVIAPIDGVISDVLVEAGEAVEYGEAVAVVETPQPETGAGDGAEGE